MLCFSGIFDNKLLVSHFRITAHLSVSLTGINCNYSRKSRANSYRTCLSKYIEIAIFLAYVFVMTYLFPLMLGCHLESNHTQFCRHLLGIRLIMICTIRDVDCCAHTKSLLTQQFQSEAWDLICMYIIVHALYIF